MYEEKELWYAVIDSEEHSEFPVKANSEREHNGIGATTVKTYELHESSAVEGKAHIAVVTGSISVTDERVIAKERHGALAAMIAFIDDEVM